MMLSNDEPALNLTAWGTAQADLASLQPLRKAIPTWAREGTPGHFLKHADEQTVVAVTAMDRAIQSLGLPPAHYADWSIIAAPRYIGRISGASALDRFVKAGAPGISPHTIPQHSLHSVSGALSILLGSRWPNFGVGGSGESLAEGLLASLTVPGAKPPGVWFVATGFEPEPELDHTGNVTNEPRCCAVALALEQRTVSQIRGRVTYLPDVNQRAACPAPHWSPDLISLSRSLDALPPGGASFAWRLSWGGAVLLEALAAGATLAAAA